MDDKIIKGFSNITRLKVLACLAKSAKNVSQLINVCGLSQSAVSQHLIVLKELGLVKKTRNGREVYYSLTYPKASEISKELINFAKTHKEK